ncbi:MAG: ABC transporter ATP-binding protein [Clostridia bacterium]|nr:ABC transporter ATP-binding protein [Clostridia bacterium]
MDNIIQVSHLSKSFGEIRAVQDLSFSVEEGSLFAFLGLNGAGKSTTISILCGVLRRSGGEVTVAGFDPDRDPDSLKRQLGVVFQNTALDLPLSVRDNLESRAALYGITGKAFRSRLDELCSLLDIGELLRRPVGKLSGGQRRRIDIARALLHQPRILILDEPTTGLDPQTRHSVWGTIAQLRREQAMTVFLTTHYMEEAADADHVVILNQGQLAAEGTPISLKNRFTGDFITLYGATEENVKVLGLPYDTMRDAFRIAVSSTKEATNLILSHPEVFCDFEITKGKMDDVFLAVTGKRPEGGEEE